MNTFFVNNDLICVFSFLPRNYRRNIWTKPLSYERATFFSYGNLGLGQGNLIFISHHKGFKNSINTITIIWATSSTAAISILQIHCHIFPKGWRGWKRQAESRKEPGIKVDISHRKDQQSCGVEDSLCWGVISSFRSFLSWCFTARQVIFLQCSWI